ncbi:MAG: DUF3142 domain-containing protein [Gammaproteobacteria bacterium]|nr:DUF3142 domain-containing protein [Gammaproteobacteria bacterium]MBU2056490.1 DUF3142 domain-containing protein [Gammaproteobacteria bacterium]MBU2173797.1 DUF3142 domain-containing protein [Gammaproteobacteria bacterium]MBU2248860.1 DUF3142 domain-containing protein [Gammaproteobacteria bacterium]MBU2342683.1 DUF3142 domain-containing protein [Gammaproteobacteria bacterium]
MKSQFKLLSLVISLCLLCSCSPQGSSAFSQHIYIWQRLWTAEHAGALAQSKTDFTVLRVLALQLHQAKAGPVWTEAKVDLPLLAADARPVHLVVRLDGQLKQLPKDLLQKKLAALLQLWQQQGVKVTQLELDYDCASSQLAAYAVWLKALRQLLPQTLAVAITALPDWLGKPGWLELQQQVDQLTLQVHSVLSAEQGLFQVELAKNWAQQLAQQAQKPFYIAVPSYHSALLQQEQGWLVESEQPLQSQAKRQELWLDAVAVQQFSLWLQQQHWPQLQGLVWFRLPLPSDKRSWSYSQLQAVSVGKTLTADLKMSVQGEAPELELVAENHGFLAAPLPTQINLSGRLCTAADAVSGYKLNFSKDKNQLQFVLTKAETMVQPRQRLVLGWASCQNLSLSAFKG